MPKLIDDDDGDYDGLNNTSKLHNWIKVSVCVCVCLQWYNGQ